METEENKMKEKSATNKEAAASFLKLVVAGKIPEAYETHVTPDMRHHNTAFLGDATSLQKAMEENHLKYPNKILNIQRTIAEGDLVAIHSWIRMKPKDRGFVHVHIFRFKNTRIVEMWGMMQPVPEDSPNENGMF